MWDNLLLASLRNGAYQDAIFAFNRLLDMRPKSNWQIDHEVLGLLARSFLESWEPGSHDAFHLQQMKDLLGRVTSMVSTEPKIWEIYAQFNEGIGRPIDAIDCRMKQCRSLLSKSGWEKEQEKVKEVVSGLEALAQAHLKDPASGNLYACEMFLRAPLKKIEDLYEGSEEHRTLGGIHSRLKCTLGGSS